jgi:hypothetical protein
MPVEIRDQYHDPAHATLAHLLHENPSAYEFVKAAELKQTDFNGLQDSQFAWPERRLFPINSAENTVLSSLYRAKTAAVPVEVDDALRSAQVIYGVKHLLAETRQKSAAAPAVKSDTKDDYLLPEHSRLRVKTAENVKAAEELLHRDYSRLGLEDRATAFTNLVKKARHLGVALKPETHRMAGFTLCTTKLAMEAIEARAAAAKQPLFKTAYDKLAAAFQKRGEFFADREQLLEAAQTLAHLDKQAGLDKMYDKGLPDPIRTVFNTDKLAEDYVDVSGRQIAVSKLASMPGTFWDDVLGPEYSTEFKTKTGEELRQLIDTLPLDLKLILKHQVP